MVMEESQDMINAYLNLLPIDQRVMLQKTIDNLIDATEQQIVIPLQKAITDEEEQKDISK